MEKDEERNFLLPANKVDNSSKSETTSETNKKLGIYSLDLFKNLKRDD